ncbi:MAG: hypothetical protein DWQ37_04740 [Planctomycetota bacterium]|nr:MAG: hypothetical protein DWQ37_04740 [Planctomycetota bacterium]
MPAFTRFRPLLRFRLRTLFVLAVVVGLVFAWIHAGREQRERVAGMTKSNPSAVVLYDYELHDDGTLNRPGEPPGPVWLRERIGVDYLADVAGVDLMYPTDADIAHLARFPNLRRLHFERSIDLTDAGLEPLLDLKQLEFLVLGEPDQITDAGLRTLGQMKSLADLRLHRGRHMTDAGIAALKRSLPHCRITIVDVYEEEVLARWVPCSSLP